MHTPKKKFKIGRKAVTANDDDYMKLSKILIAVTCVLGLDNSKKKIPLWLWVLVEDENEWEQFPWGNLSYQVTFDCIKNIAYIDYKMPQIAINIKGNSLALLVSYLY